MCAHQIAEPRTPGSSIVTWLTWLGGGDRLELNERHERSTHAVAGVVVLVNVVLTWLVTTLAVLPAVHMPAPVVVPLTLVFALLEGAMARAIATGPTRGAAGRGATAMAVVLVMALGGVVGEFAALALFSGSIDRVIQQQAARNAVSAPAVVQQSTNLQQMREARGALDQAVDAARAHRDEALIVARCEYHPTPACPQTRITGVPGSGPETRTANELLADSQRELDQAIAARDRRVPGLEDQINRGERVLDEARQSAIADVDHGLGSRWVAMQQLTSAGAGTLALHVLTVGFFIALGVLPLILRRWRGDTSHDRHAQARAERERAELIADTAIAVKRAEVRAAAETMWAEQQLEQARLAVEAQTEIDRAQLRHRVNAAIEVTTPDPEPVDDDIYLPIAAEAHAASLAAPASATTEVSEARNLPAISRAARYARYTVDSNDPRCHQSCRSLDPSTGAEFRSPRDRHVNASASHRSPSHRRVRGNHVLAQKNSQDHCRNRGGRRRVIRLQVGLGPFAGRSRQQRPRCGRYCGPGSFGASSVSGARERPFGDFRRSGNATRIGRT